MSGAARSPPKLGPVIVACGDREVADVVEAAGGRAVMTDPGQPDRVRPDTRGHRGSRPRRHHFDAVINFQGDLPLLDPAAVRLALTDSATPDIDIATLAAVIEDATALADTSVNKVVAVLCRSGPAGVCALFQQSRRAVGRGSALRAYRALRLSARGSRTTSSDCARGVLEQREHLEQLRCAR